MAIGLLFCLLPGLCNPSAATALSQRLDTDASTTVPQTQPSSLPMELRHRGATERRRFRSSLAGLLNCKLKSAGLSRTTAGRPSAISMETASRTAGKEPAGCKRAPAERPDEQYRTQEPNILSHLLLVPAMEDSMDL